MERSETVDSLFPLCCHRFINYPRKEDGARSTWLNVRRGFYESIFKIWGKREENNKIL